jgi:hypothetical protein
MRRSAVFKVAALVIALSLPLPAEAAVVRAADHSSFWIWGGVKPQPVLAGAQCLYILQGQVVEKKTRDASKVVVAAQGMPVARIRNGTVWLVYRADTLHWTAEVLQALVSRLKLWQLSGNPVAGLQVDFDVRTRRLREYVVFLRHLRGQLPAEYRLGITGLLDWSSNGDIREINQLGNIVDEVIIQTYQGRKTIANCNEYLPALTRLKLPFKIGLVQNGEWQAPEGLESNPWFRGYVVFLRNQDLH